MNEQESRLLEKLASGEYNGFCPPSRCYGSVKRGGAVDTGYYIADGQLFEYKDITRRFFDGKENERTTERTTRVVDSDSERLEFLRRLGYRMDDPEATDYSNDFYDERRRQRIEERAAVKEAANSIVLKEPVDSIDENAMNVPRDIPGIGGEPEIEENSIIDSPGSTEGILAIAAVVGVVYGVVKLAPHVKKWWNEKAVPCTKSLVNKLTKKPGVADRQSFSVTKQST